MSDDGSRKPGTLSQRQVKMVISQACGSCLTALLEHARRDGAPWSR